VLRRGPPAPVRLRYMTEGAEQGLCVPKECGSVFSGTMILAQVSSHYFSHNNNNNNHLFYI